MRAICGPAGIGKSRLALELADRLAATAEWDVEFLARDGDLSPYQGQRPLLVVIEDAEARPEQVARFAQAVRDGLARATVRVLLLSRTHDGEELQPHTADAEMLAQALRSYAGALNDGGFPYEQVDPASLSHLVERQHTPGELQALVLAALLGEPQPDPGALVRHELAYLHHACTRYGLNLSMEAVAAAATIAVLCGAADEWWEEMYPADDFPDPVTEDLIASVVTPQFLLRMLAETTQEQDRRVLKVLARIATTRSRVRTCLIDLLAVLPGLSPAAVDAALTGGHPEPLAQALTALVKNAALPAELLESVPHGTTLLGEFPVLLAESLVEAYQARLASYPESAARGLMTMLIELSGRLADAGQVERACAAAQRAAEMAGGGCGSGHGRQR